MSVADEYGISEAEWQQLDETTQNKLISGQAKLLAYSQLLGQQILEQDDEDIRKRSRFVQDSILSRDTTQCKDMPYESEDSEDMRVTILGDINSEQALNSLLQTKKQVDISGEVKAGKPSKKIPWWGRLLGTLGAVALGAGITYATARYFNQNEPQTAYDVTALPYQPGYNPFLNQEQNP